MRSLFLFLLGVLSLGILSETTHAQIVPAGSGSYTTQFPGSPIAGRREKPRGVAFGVDAIPKITSNLANRPIQTNDWWSTLIWTTGTSTDHGWPFYAYPLSFRSRPDGLAIEYTVPGGGGRDVKQPMSEQYPIVVGVNGLNTSESAVHDFTDWTVTAAWFEGNHNFTATIGMGMPFTYFEKGSSETAVVKVNTPSQVSIQGNMILIENNINGANYAVYGPAGATWTANGSEYTSTLNGKNYWSMALLPQGVAAATAAADYAQYAMVFPGNTEANYTYNQSTGEVLTNFTVTPDVKEGGNSTVLQGALPHQWGNLSGGSAQPGSYVHASVRGEIKYIASNTFSTSRTFYGILPTLPNVMDYSDSFDLTTLFDLLDGQKNSALAEYTDSYNDGKKMNRLAQMVRIADQIGHTEARDLMLNEMRTRLEDWLSAENGELDFIMYYNDTWGSMLGYPAGHGQDYNLNDHHFHWGYLIHMAAVVEQYQPGWAAQWGPMVDMLVRDAGSTDRNDPMFPYLRNFSPYAGHCWANGSGTFPIGNDQESSSESMQFHTALIHWGSVTGNTAIRDLGIYMYATEQSAIEEYWWDKNNRVFSPNYDYEVVSRVWGSGYDAYTFWTTDIEPVWGINFLPIHGGSLYLGHDPALVQEIWNDITTHTGVLQNEVNPNLWYDVLYAYLSFADPALALQLYENNPDYQVEFGESQAHTYHWMHNMNALGTVDATVTANHPMAAVFSQDGTRTYVAHNYGSSPIVVNFSDGASLNVGARSTATSLDANTGIALTSPTSGAKLGSAPNSITLTATVTAAVDKVEFWDGNNLLGTDFNAPYELTLNDVPDYVYNYVAKAYVGSLKETSGIVSVTVGAGLPQDPYNFGSPWSLPGTIEAGKYDEGGQGAAYSDTDPSDNGGDRGEGVDVSSDNQEGLTVGWIEGGEWIEFTTNVTQAGNYDITARIASPDGGGTFHFEVNEVPVGPSVAVPATGDWGNWGNVTFQNVPLNAGEQIIRVAFETNGYNLGKMTFTWKNGTIDTEAPTVPGNLTASNIGENSVDLNWNASTDNVGVTLYEVYRDGSLINSLAGTSMTASGLNGATTYNFTVRSRDAAGNFSGFASVDATTATPVPDTEAPSVPSNLSVSNETVNSLSLNWSPSADNKGVTGYEVFLDGASQGSTGATSYTFTGLNSSTTYTLAVLAQDAAGNASAQASTTGSTATPDTEAPTVPTNLGVSGETNTSLQLDWNASTDNTGVTAYEMFLNGISQGTTASTSYVYSGLTEGTTYTLAVAASDAAGNSSAQASTSGTTTVPEPGCEGDGIDGAGAGLDYTWKVSSGTNPTVTFIPARAQVGDNIVLFYHQVGGSGGFPGYVLTADANGNYNYTITAGSGQLVEFYYTYSVPEGGERNSSASMHNVTIGDCEGSTNPTNQAPSVSVTTPGEGTVFTTADPYTIDATASDSDGSVTQVEFFANGGSLGTDNTAPYSLSWNPPSNGFYGITAVATDDDGATTTSTQINVEVNVAGADTEAPAAPADLVVSNETESSLTLAWAATTDNIGVAGYEVFLDGISQGTTTGLVHVYNGLAANTPYTLAIQAYDAAGNYSAASSTQGVTTSGTTNTMTNTISMSTDTKGKSSGGIADIVVTSGGAPVANALVDVTWSGSIPGSASGTTDGNGQVTFSTGRQRNASSFTITVDNVTLSGYTWDSGNSTTTASISARGIADQERIDDELILYPNPTTQYITIAGLQGQFTAVAIYGLDGRKYQEMELESNVYQVALDVSSLQAGLYLVRLVAEDDSIGHIRFVKE